MSSSCSVTSASYGRGDAKKRRKLNKDMEAEMAAAKARSS